MIYFIADTHFNHNKAFIYNPRGFKSIYEANEAIIHNWNATVSDRDDIYVLGDFFLGEDLEYVKNTLAILNGRIRLVIGNHDSKAKLAIYRDTPNVVQIERAIQLEYDGKTFFLSHYPTITANMNDSVSTMVFNIHGHTHSKYKFYQERPYMYNVACDAQNNTPVGIDQIIADIDEKMSECESYLV